MTFPPIPGVRVLGLVGRAGHGKDLVARLLIRRVPGAERFGMSDALSAVARWSGEMTTRDPRALQRIGEAARQDRPGVWLRCLYGTIEDKQPDVAVVTGIRYPNEAAMIREMGGALVRVERYEADGSLYICPHRDPNHVSESFAATLEVDAVIRARSGDTDGIKRQVHIAARLV